MGVRRLALLVATLALAGFAAQEARADLGDGVAYLQARQRSGRRLRGAGPRLRRGPDRLGGARHPLGAGLAGPERRCGRLPDREHRRGAYGSRAPHRRAGRDEPRRRHARHEARRPHEVERPDRADRELDDLGRHRPARRGTQGSGEDRPLPQGTAGEERRLVVVRGRPGRLERHRRRDPGAPRGGRSVEREDDQAGARVPPAPPERRRRVRADPEPRLGRALDRLGDPGLRRRGEEARPAGLPLPPAAPALERVVPLQPPVRDEPGLDDRAGRGRTRPPPVPA